MPSADRLNRFVFARFVMTVQNGEVRFGSTDDPYQTSFRPIRLGHTHIEPVERADLGGTLVPQTATMTPQRLASDRPPVCLAAIVFLTGGLSSRSIIHRAHRPR